MYYEHFGLNYPPFKITPDTQLFYAGGKRGLVLDALVYAISHGEGIVKVVGEVGSGKTMLCRMLEKKLPKQIEVVYLANPSLPPDMILHAIALEMRLPVTPQNNRLQVMHTLHTRLLEKHANNQQVVVFIEEAQGMPLETLEEIRLLSNLETTRNKLLQIVLFGQPELDTHLSATFMRQLKERITHSFYLEPLTRDNIREYLDFRMKAVGYRGTPVFSSAAIRILTRVSKGLVRRVNILADKSLLAAFANDVYIIRSKQVRLAARDSGFACPRFSAGMWLSLILVIALIVGFWFSPYRETAMTWLQTINLSITSPTTPPILTITTDSILQQRIQATQRWLAKANGQHYSIQLMQAAANKTDHLVYLLRQPEMQPLLEYIYLHRIIRKGQVFWEVMYGEFAKADEATAAIITLPQILQHNKPYLRKIANFQ